MHGQIHTVFCGSLHNYTGGVVGGWGHLAPARLGLGWFGELLHARGRRLLHLQHALAELLHQHGPQPLHVVQRCQAGGYASVGEARRGDGTARLVPGGAAQQGTRDV